MRALILGIGGQDGSYLSELLLAKGYGVSGVIRRASSLNTSRIDHIFDKLNLYHGDVTDLACLTKILAEVKPDEVYSLAAQSHVAVSFQMPLYTAHVDALGVLNLLEAVRVLRLDCRIYQASTSELYGDTPSPQNENTPFKVRSPYALAKLYAYELIRMYRDAYGMWACNGVLYNHESPRRGETFVTRKITKGLAAIKRGELDRLVLGNLDSRRDWGHARCYVEAMWLMLQQPKPVDYVIGTGEQYSVRDFVNEAAKNFGMDLVWHENRAYLSDSKKLIVDTDQKYLRPLEVPDLCADASKARRELGWKPRTSFQELVREMCLADQ